MSKKFVEIDCENIKETDLAVLLDNGDVRKWFPKSQLDYWPYEGYTGTAIIEEWIAVQEGFI